MEPPAARGTRGSGSRRTDRAADARRPEYGGRPGGAAWRHADEELRLVAERTHDTGLPVTVHAHGLPAVEQAIRAGVDGIEHCGCLTVSGIEMSETLVQALVESRITVCPTLGRSADGAPTAALRELMQRTGLSWEAKRQQVGRMHRAGVRVVSGADSGIGPGKPHGILPAAVAGLVAGGVSPEDALASATSVAAEGCGLGRRKGRLRAGYDADLLIVGGDPLARIEDLSRVAAVMVRGSWAGDVGP